MWSSLGMSLTVVGPRESTHPSSSASSFSLSLCVLPPASFSPALSETAPSLLLELPLLDILPVNPGLFGSVGFDKVFVVGLGGGGA